jgi:hypothetical protein
LAAFKPGDAKAKGARPDRVVPFFVMAVALLAIFQLVLRPGITI